MKEKYGKSRWGFKEVRLTIDHARYLKWLFPNAKFIFVYRNLFDAYRSWRGNIWGSTWPGYYSNSPTAFARHWKLLLSGFLNGYKEVDGILVKFEDLVSGNFPLQRIADHLGVSRVDSLVLEKKIGSPNESKRRRRRALFPYEKLILYGVARSLLKKLGYV